VLDAVDPDRAFVFARDPRSLAEATAALVALGYAPDGPISAGEAMPGNVNVLVFYDLPASRDELRAVIGGHTAQAAVALVSPRQRSTLRAIAGGSETPLRLPEAFARAHAEQARLRDELRVLLAAGDYGAELLALEPLLAEYDGAEVAAAAVRMLESIHRAAPAGTETAGRGPTGAAPDRGAPPARTARVFVNAGLTDGIRPGDLVGVIANVAGLSGREVGRVDLHERHALVELPQDVAATVASKLTGVTLKGRQLVARLDQEPSGRGDRSERGARGPAVRRPRR
jgi:ATP-dependent RNA helicase DeaD